MNRKRSRGIAIMSLTETFLGLAGIVLATIWVIQAHTIYGPSNINAGFLLIFALYLYLVSLPLFIGGILMFRLKPGGRIVSICVLVLVIPFSIPLIIYLFRADVKAQFRAGGRDG